MEWYLLVQYFCVPVHAFCLFIHLVGKKKKKKTLRSGLGARSSGLGALALGSSFCSCFARAKALNLFFQFLSTTISTVRDARRTYDAPRAPRTRHAKGGNARET